MKVNFQETIRLVLRNAFKHDDPALTAEMLDLYQKCPNLFNKVLSRADRNELEESLLEGAEHEVGVTCPHTLHSWHSRTAAFFGHALAGPQVSQRPKLNLRLNSSRVATMRSISPSTTRR